MTHSPPLLTALTFAALLLAVLGLWWGRKVWIALTAVAVVLGYASGVLTGPAALWLVALAACCVAYVRLESRSSGFARVGTAGAALGVVVIGILLGAHALPGFNNFRVAENLTLSPGATPYTLYLNFDKTMVGILLLGALGHPLIRHGRDWTAALRATAPVLVVTVAIVIVGSLALGYVRVEPGAHALFWIWAPANLLMTCLGEEAFFRGFLQRTVRARLASRRYADSLAIAIAAVAFGVAHLAGGAAYVALATIAGAGYGYAYARTGRIEMAMLTHFALNATHFLLFTYPRAA